MANSLLVSIGFRETNDNLLKVFEGVKNLNEGIKDVVSSTKGLNSEVDKVSKSLDRDRQFKLIQNLRAYSSGIKDVFQGFSGFGKALVDPIRKQFDFARSMALTGDKVAKTSRLVGLSVKDYQAFSSAAKHAGMSSEEMDAALKRFNVGLGKARGGDETSLKMFDAILGGKKLSDYKDSTSLLKEIANGYNKLATAEQKAFVTQELFGRSSAKMSELLSGGEDGIKKLIADYESQGGGYSEKGAKDAEEFNDELQRLLETFNSLKIKVAEEVFPIFTELFKTMRTYVKDNASEIIPKVRDIFAGLSGVVKDLLPKIPAILDKILSIVDFIGPNVFIIGSTVGAILPSVLSIVMGLATLKSVLSFVLVPLKAIFMYGHGLVIGAKLLAGLIGGPMLASIGLVVAAFVVWGKVFKDIYDNSDMLISFIMDDVIPPIRDFFVGFAGTIGDFCSMVGDKFLGLFNGLGDVFLGIGQSIMDFCSGAISKIFGFVEKIKDAFSGLFGSFPDKIKSLFGVQGSLNQTNSSEPVSTLGSSVAQTVSESHTTTTSRFAVDFKNMPRGVQVTAPDHGDFDYSRGYVLAGM